MGYINNSRKWDKCAVLLTLHTRPPPPSRRLRALSRPRRRCRPSVYLLSCLYVVSSDALRSSVFTDPKQKGACNQGKGRLRVIKYQFTRRHSFCNFYQECTLTRFSRNRQKKTSSSDKVSFISPIRYPDRLSF